MEGFPAYVKASNFAENAERGFDPEPGLDSLVVMIQPGGKLDLNLRLDAVREGRIERLALGELVQRRAVLSVHMRNNTPGCDRQNLVLAERAKEFARAGYDLIGFSRDSAKAHAKYALAKKIPFPLVSDPEDKLAGATGSLIEKSMYGRKFVGPARAAFVVEKDGTVLAVVEKIVPADAADQVWAAIANLP